ncbi:MAG: hypothetical protein KatS3mg111_0044 [Pirellulaceae bacterium]|nr:MAG: hypothetical protein KatS3mg111_0044 [Pirellulaceae bacterium]
MEVEVLAGLSFGSAWMLAWGVAATIPLILHLLHRRRQHTVRWAAMHLLMRVLEKESRRIRLEQWLMLLLRMAILAVLAVAVARPSWLAADGRTFGTSRPPVLWILAIDGSYSMQQSVSQGGTVFTAALAAVEDLINRAPEGDAFTVLMLSQPSRAVVGEPTFDRTSVLAQVEQLRPLDHGADMASAMAIMQRVIEEAEQRSYLPRQVRIMIYSDMGEDTWQPVVGGAGNTAWRRLTQEAQVSVVPIVPDDRPNYGVADLRLSTLRPTVGQSLDVDVVVENFSALPKQGLPVQLQVDERSVASRRIDLSPLGRANVHFELPMKSPGHLVVSAIVGDDSLPADNDRYVSIEVESVRRVLIVERQSASGRLLQLGLDPQPEPESRWRIQRQTVVEVQTEQWSNWDVVVLDDGVLLNEALHQRLYEFVRRGGSLVAMFGPHTDPESWNRLEQQRSLLGFQLLGPGEERDWQIDPLDYRSPVVSPFAGYPLAGLITTPLFRLWRIDRRPDVVVDVGTNYDAPLVVHRRLGRGAILSWLSAPQAGADDRGEVWNAIAAWPSFVPLLQQSVQALMDLGVASLNGTVGEPLEGGAVDSSAPTVRLITPAGGEHLLTMASSPSGEGHWRFEETDWHGIYRAHYPDGTTIPYSVNLHVDQSRQRRVAPEELPQSAAADDAREHETMAAGQVGVQPALARWLLFVLAGLLVAESLLGATVGRRLQ